MKAPHIVTQTFLPKSFGSSFLQIKRGKGVFLWDEGGKKYLDMGSGIAVNSLGYGNRGLMKAIKRQAKRVIHTSNLYTTGPALELAQKLTDLGDFAAVHFGNSGTEANEAALKFARLYALKTKGPQHTKFLSFHGAFHGRTMGALSVTPTAKYKDPFGPLLPGCVDIPLNDVQKLTETLDESFAGVIIEPLQGEGGLNSLDPDFVETLNKLCHEKNIILIADEVQSGLSRTGSLLASQQVGLKPDIVTLSKPLAGGLPLSATLIPAKINDLLEPGHHGTTFGGGPLATAAAIEVLRQVSQVSFRTSVKEKGEYLEKKLVQLKNQYPFLGEIKGMGLLRGITLNEEKAGFTLADLLVTAREKGLLLLRCGKDVLRLAPPLVITTREIDLGIKIFSDTLFELSKES